MAHWVRHRPTDPKGVSSILSQGTCLSCRPGPLLGVCERQPIAVFLPLSLPFTLSKNIQIKSKIKPLMKTYIKMGAFYSR